MDNVGNEQTVIRRPYLGGYSDYQRGLQREAERKVQKARLVREERQAETASVVVTAMLLGVLIVWLAVVFR